MKESYATFEYFTIDRIKSENGMAVALILFLIRYYNLTDLLSYAW